MTTADVPLLLALVAIMVLGVMTRPLGWVPFALSLIALVVQLGFRLR